MDFSWGGTEQRPGEYDFSAYDRLLAALEAHKLRALFILDYGNRLYETDSGVATEAGRRAFARWAAAAAVHFKGHGILWEIWNEPNGGFWKPKANVDDYAALALAAAKAIRAAAPGEAVIGPATSGVDLQFAESCFKAGLLDWWDAVSVHPYRQSGPESAAADYQKLRALIARYAPKGKSIPIISGEWGYSSAWQNFDDATQGQMLARQWLVNLANHIPLSIWYDWHDDGIDPKEPEHHFGSVANAYHAGGSPVYEPKPAYLAAKTLTSVLTVFTSPNVSRSASRTIMRCCSARATSCDWPSGPRRPSRNRCESVPVRVSLESSPTPAKRASPSWRMKAVWCSRPDTHPSISSRGNPIPSSVPLRRCIPCKPGWVSWAATHWRSKSKT